MIVKIVSLVLAFISFSFLLTQISYGESDEKNFTNTKFGISMKYPSDWNFTTDQGDTQNASLGDFLYGAYFCPAEYVTVYNTCSSDSPVKLSINAFKLKEGFTVKEFYDEMDAGRENVKRLVGSPKIIETTKSNITGLSALQTVSTHSGNSGSLGSLLKGIGKENPTSKDLQIFAVNGSTGYLISGSSKDESDFDTYLPTFQKMISSIQIQGAKENPANVFPNLQTAPTVDVVLLSHKLKRGSGGYNDIIGQVKNVGSDTVEFVKIGLTVYDKNGDVVGTDSVYAASATLKPNQKSTFDIFSSKDNFIGMKNYELSLQWRASDGEDQYIDNAQIYRVNSAQ